MLQTENQPLTLTPEERLLVDKVHDFMSYTNYLISNSHGQIPNINYKEIPEDATILLFGGYRTPAFHTVDVMKAYHKKYDKWPDIILTGKSSNKFNNTAGLGSEVNIYQYILEECGIPQEVVRKYYIEPTDTSTAENAQKIREILEKHPHLKDKPLIIFTQSYYARRAVHDLGQMLPDQQLMVANLPKADFDNGHFYNDRGADGNAFDVMLGACFYQSMYNQSRWEEKGETLPPTAQELSAAPSLKEIKPLLERYHGWLYPNNMVDLGFATDLLEGKLKIDERKAQLPCLHDLALQRTEINSAIKNKNQTLSRIIQALQRSKTH